jgi:diguanylate cyclase (GGDEF)-like protein
MDLTNNIIINIYSIMLLIIICHNSLKHDERESLQHKLYMMVLMITIMMLIVDIFSRFDGKPDTVYPVVNHFGNFMIFLLNPILPSLWLLYVHVQVFQDEKKTRRLIYPLLTINVVNTVMIILNHFFGWYYYIDSDNIYHRGPLFLLSALITVALIVVAFVLIIANRKKIEKKHYFSLVFFAVPPSVCIILQIIYYGMSLMLNSVVLSLLMVSLNIQNHSMYTDYLTGVNNRNKLETYLKEKISTSTEDKTFSAIMIDLNSFKSINDNFGHDMGDNALRVFAKLLNSCIRANDFIARFGGDEFFIVLDISDRIALEEIVRRINVCVEKYNESNDYPYKLDFSMGYAVYDYHSHMKVEEFQKQIDILMYKNKQANKEIKRNSSRI